MIVTLYCYNYNNYYNRIIKKKDTIEEYGAYVHYENGVNFNFSDGVNTSQVINTDLNPDYVIVVDEQGNINSRWFVIDADYQRNGQHVFTLHRDVIADNLTAVLNAPVFIEKATLNDTDPFIFNSENMSFNQIKTSETLLKDETNIPWIVGYWTGKEQQDEEAQSAYDVTPDIIVDTLSDYTYYNYSDKKSGDYYYRYHPALVEFKFYVDALDITGYAEKGYEYRLRGGSYIVINSKNSLYNSSYSLRGSGSLYSFPTAQQLEDTDNALLIEAHQAARAAAYTQYGWATTEEANILAAEEGKILYDENTQKYYKISVVRTTVEDLKENIAPGSSVSVAIDNKLSQTYYVRGSNTISGSLKIDAQVSRMYLHIEELTTNTVKAKISASHRKTVDQPYDLFCLPFGDYKFTIGNNEITTNKSISWTAAMALARKYMGASAKYLYDIQLVPYCPVRKYIDSNGYMDLTDATVNKDYTYITDVGNNANIGVILFAESSSFSLQINYSKQVENTKIENECDLYRLCSPNYASQFEFSLAKNGGIDFIDVDCTYKPYFPYIHVQPNFKNLYGADYDDARGLICSGDFSLPAETDKWADYELANKNYQMSFDRQIENMEVNNSYQKEMEQFNAGIGTVAGALAGAGAGATVGGPLGAAVGGVAGLGASLVGGLKDLEVKEALRAEALDYTKDQFGYQLGNIKALPYSLSKVGAYTKNNKLFPILEYYTCTDEEKQALIDKLKYNGMTVMRIGKINDYLQAEPSYIKGKLIRLEIEGEDYHMINSISAELDKGVFI